MNPSSGKKVKKKWESIKFLEFKKLRSQNWSKYWNLETCFTRDRTPILKSHITKYAILLENHLCNDRMLILGLWFWKNLNGCKCIYCMGKRGDNIQTMRRSETISEIEPEKVVMVSLVRCDDVKISLKVSSFFSFRMMSPTCRKSRRERCLLRRLKLLEELSSKKTSFQLQDARHLFGWFQYSENGIADPTIWIDSVWNSDFNLIKSLLQLLLHALWDFEQPAELPQFAGSAYCCNFIRPCIDRWELWADLNQLLLI